MEKNQFRGVILKKFENLSIYNSLTTHVSDLISSKVEGSNLSAGYKTVKYMY